MKRPRITIAQVLKYSEIQILIFCATFRHVSIMLNFYFDDPTDQTCQSKTYSA